MDLTQAVEGAPELLKQMLTFLRQAIDRIYQTVESIYLPSG
jgi:hypothetical protein